MCLRLTVMAMISVGCSDTQQATPSTAPIAHTGPSSSAASVPATSSATVLPNTAPSLTTTVTSTANLITRPYIDPTICGAGAVSFYPSNDVIYFPFAMTREEPIPLQVIAEASGGAAKPFAVVVRLFASDRDFTNDHPAVINGTEVYITIFQNGNGQAAWILPDGSKAYIRSRDLDQPALEALVARLSPRDRTAAIPGFDLAPTTDPNGLILLHEHLNIGLSGTVTMFQCQTGVNQGVYRIRVIDGDAVFVYFGIVDVPRPYAVGVNGDGATTIENALNQTAITIQQVVNADPATWAALPAIKQ